jgi:hypothetical protein
MVDWIKMHFRDRMGVVWTEFIWLKIGRALVNAVMNDSTNVEKLSVATQQTASQLGLISVELVTFYCALSFHVPELPTLRFSR